MRHHIPSTIDVKVILLYCVILFETDVGQRHIFANDLNDISECRCRASGGKHNIISIKFECIRMNFGEKNVV